MSQILAQFKKRNIPRQSTAVQFKQGTWLGSYYMCLINELRIAKRPVLKDEGGWNNMQNNNQNNKIN